MMQPYWISLLLDVLMIISGSMTALFLTFAVICYRDWDKIKKELRGGE